jgi:hypothetical protein
MNTGGMFGFERVLRFNGSFFENATAIALPKDQLEVLYAAAAKDWSNVEPAIFGTLLERALEKKERSRLGAHYTPRSYVERLVRPVVMEPLRQEWDEIEIELKRLLEPAEDKEEPTATQRRKAEQEITTFLQKLRSIKILDPACGTGNFLYVSLDLLKGLEAEVMTRLTDVVGEVQLNVLEQINPSQFLGIEINPRAAAIAELVIWIGYLQWYFKRFGNAEPPEPVLQAFGNIENRDAVLAYDGKEPDVDPKTGKVRTRWGGRMMTHPVTGEEVPDPADQVEIYRYLNPRPAEWPKADYVVSNPPFIGNRIMRETLGDGYTETLRNLYRDVPNTVDYVMYWWHKSASLVRAKKLIKFGLITTNTLTQMRLRSLIDFHLVQKKAIDIFFAIPDHPWVDGGAAVRISMTACKLESNQQKSEIARLGEVITESEGDTPEEIADQVYINWKHASKIYSDLRIGTDFNKAIPLKSNTDICFDGMKPYGKGFTVERKNLDRFTEFEIKEVLKPYRNGRDINQRSRDVFIIDCYGLSENNLQKKYPTVYQWLLEKVHPKRSIQRDQKIKENWWLFERNRPDLRKALERTKRYIVTAKIAKHRVFIFEESKVIPDQKVISIALEDAYFLGLLSSQTHILWALTLGGTFGGTLEDRPNYNQTQCFDPFPFPDPTPEQKQKIRDLGERLDAHRKQVQAAHPDITITGMYNLPEKLRAGEPFTDKDWEYNDRALVSTLKQIHDELDAAVLEAYGWDDLMPLLDPPKSPFKRGTQPTSPLSQGGTEGGSPATSESLDEIILERLVSLNAQRAEEERNGIIRWLRPDYQNPGQAPDEVQTTQATLEGIATPEEAIVEPVEQRKWPSQPKEQLAAIRDLLRTTPGEWTVAQLAVQFKGRITQKKLQDITDNLERMEFFSQVIAVERDGITYWHYAESAIAA